MLDAYVRYARAASITRYLVVTALFVAGLMSKPMLVTVPIVLLLLDYWPLRRFAQISSTRGKAKILQSGSQRRIIRRLFLERFPCSSFPPAPVSSHLCCKSAPLAHCLRCRFSGGQRMQSRVTLSTPWKTLWPTRLAVFYPHPNDTLATWQVVLTIAFLLAITFAAIVWRDKRPYLFTRLVLVPLLCWFQ